MAAALRYEAGPASREARLKTDVAVLDELAVEFSSVGTLSRPRSTSRLVLALCATVPDVAVDLADEPHPGLALNTLSFRSSLRFGRVWSTLGAVGKKSANPLEVRDIPGYMLIIDLRHRIFVVQLSQTRPGVVIILLPEIDHVRRPLGYAKYRSSGRSRPAEHSQYRPLSYGHTQLVSDTESVIGLPISEVPMQTRLS